MRRTPNRLAWLTALLVGTSLALVPLAPAGSLSEITYAALGDSFSSGIDDGNECGRSRKAYPRLLERNTTNLQLGNRFLACSGATTDDVRQEQIPELGKRVELVTLTVGGNDVGFRAFAATCVITRCSFGYARIEEDIREELPRKLAKTYRSIGKRTGSNADVVVLGYPQIVPRPRPSEPACAGFGDDDKRLARKVTRLINRVIRSQAAQAGFEFVKANGRHSPFRGHELCTKKPYFERFHPNARGMRAYYRLARDKLRAMGLISAVAR